MSEMALLEVKNLTKYFGGLAALNGVSFEVNKGEILGLIGPNGAGKSTLFNVVSGVFKPTAGSIIFEGESISRLRPNEIAKRGIIRTYQANILFPDLTAIENVMIGYHLQTKAGFFGFLFNSATAREDDEKVKIEAIKILGYCGIASVQHELAKNLPHGHQRMLAIAMALAAKPKLLLLDEPVTGMNAEEVSNTVELVRKLKETGITVVIVEHTMKVVMNLCERIVVLRFGQKLAEGTPQQIQSNKDVIEAYLGVD